MKYRKKPIVIEAIQWDGLNEREIRQFAKGCICTEVFPPAESLFIETLEGVMEAKKGDYIIKGVNGEFYPCKPDIFEKSYEQVEE